DQCQSGFCRDGRCCTTPCDGPCEACSVAKRGAGLDGECGAVAAGTDPDDECVDQGAASCGQSGMCSGGLSCATYSTSTVCEPAACTGQSTLRVAGTCAQGSCDPGGTTSCAPYARSGSACKTSCSLDLDCASLRYCDGFGSCRPKAAVGTLCSKKSQCLSGNCVDGYCCENACSGMCMTCGNDGYAQPGFCSPVACGPPGAECPGARRCSAGSCMDMCILIE